MTEPAPRTLCAEIPCYFGP